VTETARALLVAAVLTGLGLLVFVQRLVRIDPAEPARLIGELRFSHWMSAMASAVGGAWLGLAVARSAQIPSGLDLTIAIALILLGAWTLQRETRQALTILCIAFLAHAIIDTAHRPGFLEADLAPRWFTLGCAAFNLLLSALCYRVQRR
jgi:uncharacterized membrane protein YhdT